MDEPSRRKRKPTAQYANLSSQSDNPDALASQFPAAQLNCMWQFRPDHAIAEMDATRKSEQHPQGMFSDSLGRIIREGSPLHPTLGQGLGVQPFCSGREYCEASQFRQPINKPP